MTNLIERTAKSEFQLAGKPVRAGQIVTVDSHTLSRLVAAGVVEADEIGNSRVPVDNGAALQREAVNADVNAEQARVAEARQAADLELSAIDDRLATRRTEVASELDAVNTDLQAAITKARAEADAQIAAINKTVDDRRVSSQVEIDEMNASVETAKAIKKPSKSTD
ncbi:hypothetical protein C8J36_103529 [Rhizobium sp. PP-F2F-G48]|uniref:hypothetical protein n=1 Tax=Rhizobium sp. PP-F2F-G48 TaxID=2135651 RepID=UPI00104DBFF3|nr:hypothetical protein [Rhizobium sp. PP-F2F-G48]TCM56159.1 hypothetical protein C8J36_103529 [Rhizobium sp. PP-F2F-G48]